MSLQRHDRFILYAAQFVLLQMTAGVVPGHPRYQVRREPLQASFVLVGHGLFVGLGDRLHSNQVGAAIYREAQIALKNAR